MPGATFIVESSPSSGSPEVSSPVGACKHLCHRCSGGLPGHVAQATAWLALQSEAQRATKLSLTSCA